MSKEFVAWVNRMIELDNAGKVQAAKPLRRNESFREFFANRSSH